MKVLFIQLSDIHFTKSDNHFLEKAEQLFNAISNNTLGVDEIFLLITGDVAFSGKKEEYVIASEFITNLVLKIEIYSKVSVNIILIPGNHDCDFSEKNKARENMIRVIESSGESAVDESVVNILTQVQEEYFAFSDSFVVDKCLIYKNKMLNVFKYKIEDKTITINCINSAYISQLHEKPGQMMIPINSLGYDFSKEKSDLVVTIFHHPTHWLNPDNKREFKNIIEGVSDVYLTGHEHQATKSLITDLESNSTIYIEGNVAQDSNDRNNSGFNLVIFDLKINKLQIKNYQWEDSIYTNLSSNKWISYERGITKISNPFDLNKEFKSSLNDIGANLSHPNVSQVSLIDMYTFPRLEYLSYNEEDIKNRVRYDQDSESLIDSLEYPVRIALTGPENIGKSAFLKVLFLKLHSKGLVPILVEGKRINKTGIDEFKKNVLDTYLRQYNNINEEYFHQLSKEKIVIIIDNFDKVSFNEKYKGRLLANLLDHYGNIIVTGNELMSLEDFLSEEDLNHTLTSNFKTYKIKEFGHLLKSKFINKWITLGVEELLSETDRIRKLDEIENIVNTVTGRNLVPNYPIFLLTILQAVELDNPTDLTASTFGHYYYFLIQKSFGKVLKAQHDITSYNNYVGELAYHLFKNKVKYISYSDLGKFDESYRQKYTISHSMNQIVENLHEAKIIEEYDKTYEFKYLYIYYFFTSKYFAENIGDEEIRKTVRALVARVYRTEFANILLFLTHHTKDDFLLEEVLSSAKSIFEKINFFKLEPGNTAISLLVRQLPKVTYNIKSIDEHRDDINNRKDDMQAIQKEETESELLKAPDLFEDTSNLDIIAQLNLSFKMMEILGQILKNNYGKIPNPKLYELVEQTYLLGLRTLNIFFLAIEKNIDNLVSQIQSIVAEKNIKDPKKVESASKQILFAICSEIMYAFIKKVSESLGTQNLQSIYDAVLRNYEYNSIKLIDFSIKLDYYKQFPNTEMKKLKGEFLKTPLATNVMRKMVIEYLYLFPAKAEQKQKILSFLDITMDAQRKIDFTSKSRKK